MRLAIRMAGATVALAGLLLVLPIAAPGLAVTLEELETQILALVATNDQQDTDIAALEADVAAFPALDNECVCFPRADLVGGTSIACDETDVEVGAYQVLRVIVGPPPAFATYGLVSDATHFECQSPATGTISFLPRDLDNDQKWLNCRAAMEAIQGPCT